MAAEVYRWVDERGVVNMSDVVPEKYKAVAQRVEVPVEPDGSVKARAALPASGASAPPAPPAAAQRRAVTPTTTPTAVAARRTSAGSLSPSDDNEDCAVLQRRFKEAQECLGPRPHTINGGINGARAPQCPIVVDPSPRCGLPNNGEGPPAPGP